MRPGSSLLICLLALFGGIATAQQKNPGQYSIPIPERMERPTVEDEHGLLQWVDLSTLSQKERLQFRCPTCEGTGKQECPFCWRMEHFEKCPECGHGPDEKKRETVCRTCAGTGTTPDLLEHAPCPGCSGAGVLRCHCCGGEGTYPAEKDSDRRAKCPVCRGDGGYACAVCDGHRLVDPPKLKPSIRDAGLEELKKAQEALGEVAAALAALETSGDGRKDAKLWGPALKPGLRYFPVLKDVQKLFETITKDMSKGTMFVAYAEMVGNSFGEKKQSLEYWIKHQQRLLQLCIERAEHNAKATGGK
ncbi:MAG: hypothetical protein IPM29_25880 [Planctomycetes bacterium]|nr:hypothetical protein [Planctomycetota bacterium]